MTGSTLTALAASPAPNPETGLISIRFKHPLFGCRIPHALFSTVSLPCILRVKRANMQASALWMPNVENG